MYIRSSIPEVNRQPASKQVVLRLRQPMQKRYRDLNTYFRELFGHRVHKITVDAGMTCPNRDGTLSTGGCIYCNSKGSGTGAALAGKTIREQIERVKARVARRFKAKKFIAYFQSYTNTYAPVKTLKALYDEALGVQDVTGLAIGTRPDCVNTEILDLLESYAAENLVWIEYGLQSAHDDTLRRINRGHDVACFERAVAATKGRGINICAHVILGLPGETRREMLETARFLSDIGIDGVKLHLLYVIRGTKLETLYNKGRFKCLGQEEYAALVCDFLERIPGNMIIQRLTGDPHPNELAAPRWALEKKQTLEMIKDILEQRDTWQGRLVDEHPAFNIELP